VNRRHDLAYLPQVGLAVRRGEQEPARPKDAPYLAERATTLGHVVEHVVGGDGVEPPGPVGERGGVTDGERPVEPGSRVRDVLPRRADHPRRRVGDVDGPRDPVGVLHPEVARPGTETEHFVARVEPLRHPVEPPRVQPDAGRPVVAVERDPRLEVLAVGVLLAEDVAVVTPVGHGPRTVRRG
jgi:hypothetical protein